MRPIRIPALVSQRADGSWALFATTATIEDARARAERELDDEDDGLAAVELVEAEAAHEAGRLAATRDDVADYVGWCERSASHHDAEAVALQKRVRKLPIIEAMRLLTGMFGYGHHKSEAARYRRHAADCRRWLEATR